MAKGIVTTARGIQLNIDMLIEGAKRPLGQKFDHKSEITPMVVRHRSPINVRGIATKAGDTPVPAAPQIHEDPITIRPDMPRAFRRAEDGQAQSMADLTGIRIDEAKNVRLAKPGEPGAMSPSDLAEKVLLNDVLGGLQKQAPRALAEAERIEKEQKRKPKKAEDELA